MDFKTLKDFDYKGKKVILRVDFNVPVKDGKIEDDKRIKASLPTINYLLQQNAKLMVIAHFGEPKQPSPEFSLKIVADRLSSLLNRTVIFVDEITGEKARAACSGIKEGEIVLLENLRFNPGETANDESFAKELASYAELYVNDGFGVSHRKHASVAGIPKFLPAAAGFLMEKELNALSFARDNPEHPFIAIFGGVKISTRIKLIENFLKRADKLLLGGAMIFTFYKARGIEIGKSIVEPDFIEMAKKLLEQYPDKIVLPIDLIDAAGLKVGSEFHQVDFYHMEPDKIAVDIGPKTVEHFLEECKNAKTIVWNGPMGAFEIPEFAVGTNKLAQGLAGLNGCKVIVGGGDSAAAIAQIGLESSFYHISTGGGASLTFLEGTELPGVAALRESLNKFR
jgi:3-phosphoglycerate kinase